MEQSDGYNRGNFLRGLVVGYCITVYGLLAYKMRDPEYRKEMKDYATSKKQKVSNLLKRPRRS